AAVLFRAGRARRSLTGDSPVKLLELEAEEVNSASLMVRIHGGTEPLDSTGIHPESYDRARQLKLLMSTYKGEGFNSLLQYSTCDEDSEQARTTSAEVLTELVEAGKDVRLEHPERYRPPEIEYPPYKGPCGNGVLEV
ncbi:hypothetical protein FOZ63_012526, partial [Perkinsus olseni]